MPLELQSMANPCCVLCRRPTEGARVFAAELRGAFITNFESDMRGTPPSGDEQRSCLQEAQPLLELKRTHCRYGLEVTMKR